MKGITPVIATIFLLFITVALVASAYTYLNDYLNVYTSQNFVISPGYAYCQNGVVEVWVSSLSEAGLVEADFIVHEVDSEQIQLINLGTKLTKSDPPRKILKWDCNGEGCRGYHTVNLGTKQRQSISVDCS